MNDAYAGDRLREIDHIVVVMMENRSFDHMLGYLSLPETAGGRGRGDIDGLTGNESNDYDGEPYGVQPMSGPGLTKLQDPGHTGADVGQQMAHGMSGFVTNYMTTRAYQAADDVMRYQERHDVPVYDFFAEQFAVLDRWFCSVPGATWPNRLSAVAGEARSRDNQFPPLYRRRSFVQTLEQFPKVSWRWYSSDPGSLRLVDDQYLVGYHDQFANTDKASAVQPRTFHTDAMSEELPNVAWVDPNFVDLGGLQGANDDHPPTDVMAGQSFVLRIYESLRQSALWDKSMLVIVYDEHGGFYDHVDPTVNLPKRFTDRAEFGHFGPRVPAIVVSPWVKAGSAFGSAQESDERFVFDHTALIKTILLRFAEDDCRGLPERVASSSHLGHVLTATAPRPGPGPEIDPERIGFATAWWAKNIETSLRHPAARIPALQELGVVAGPTGFQAPAQTLWAAINRLTSRLVRRRPPEPDEPSPAEAVAESPQPFALTDATELERGIAAAAQHIRGQGLPRGQP